MEYVDPLCVNWRYLGLRLGHGVIMIGIGRRYLIIIIHLFLYSAVSFLSSKGFT